MRIENGEEVTRQLFGLLFSSLRGEIAVIACESSGKANVFLCTNRRQAFDIAKQIDGVVLMSGEACNFEESVVNQFTGVIEGLARNAATETV